MKILGVISGLCMYVCGAGACGFGGVGCVVGGRFVGPDIQYYIAHSRFLILVWVVMM